METVQLTDAEFNLNLTSHRHHGRGHKKEEYGHNYSGTGSKEDHASENV